jgi:hypothetical protein
VRRALRVRRLLRRAVAALLAGALVTLAVDLQADDVAVPVPLQMALLVKVAGYDKNLRARAGDRVHVLLLTKSGSDESARVAAQADKALSSEDAIGGLPHDEFTTGYVDGAALARLCKSRRVSIVYVTTGFADADVQAIAAALSGGDVLSASAVSSYVQRGVVLGFDLVSGKPKLLVHLGQAKRQHVDLSADVLKLVRVVD